MYSLPLRDTVQPFVAVGVALRRAGHRVRLASHADFRAHVEPALEFFPLDGDQEALARFAVDSGGNFVLSMSLGGVPESYVARKAYNNKTGLTLNINAECTETTCAASIVLGDLCSIVRKYAGQ